MNTDHANQVTYRVLSRELAIHVNDAKKYVYLRVSLRICKLSEPVKVAGRLLGSIETLRRPGTCYLPR